MLGSASHPHALGGLIGSLFFAGYMLTQFPGGYLGDRFGHRTMLAVSLLWAGVATLASGLVSGLIAFVVLRVLTGLGEGVFYSNDRSLIAQRTPPAKAGLGMGVAITGLAIGLTVATISAPVSDRLGRGCVRSRGRLADAVPGPGRRDARVRLGHGGLSAPYRRPARATGSTLRLLGISAVLCAAVLAVSLIADGGGAAGAGAWPSWSACSRSCSSGRSSPGAGSRLGAVSRNRNVLLLSFAFIAVMWNLWFFSFWSVSIVADAAHSSFQNAALVATFNAGAGILGFPAGGWLSDRAKTGAGGGGRCCRVHRGPGAAGAGLRAPIYRPTRSPPCW